MYFNFRSPNKKEKDQISENADTAENPDAGLLKVELPHWALDVKVYDSLLQPVAEIGKIKNDSEKSGGYVTETSLSPGVYQVETILEGKTLSEWIPVRPNQVTQVSGEAWKSLEFTSSAPLQETDTSRESHQKPAEKWSRTTTWTQKSKGDSRLFLFVRTLKPERYGKTFCDGLTLLNENGELVTDFRDGIAQDKGGGWMAFNAYLPSGGYILRRGRSGVLLRSQVVYLCKGWKTQVFLNSKRFPSLSTMSLNMTPPESGFQPADQIALAAEAILNNLRYGADIRALFSSDKIAQILDTLLDQKKENPWLGILAAHIILKFRDEVVGSRATETFERQQVDFSEYFRILEEKINPFLQRTIPSHPDARALLLSGDSSESFDFPPMLWASLKLVQANAAKFVETIPKDSLTDCVLDNLVVNSPWTAWRTLSKLPKPALTDGQTSGKRLFDVRTEKTPPISVSTSYLQMAVPKAPVYRFSQPENDDFGNIQSSDNFPSRQVSLQDAPIIQRATEIVKDFVQTNKLEELPEKINLNSSAKISEILENVKASEISESVGLTLSRAESGLASLKMQAGNIQSDDSSSSSSAVAAKPEKSALCAQQVILQYALSKIERISPNSSTDETSQAAAAAVSLNISGLIGKLQTEADRISLNAAKSEDESKAREIVKKLIEISAGLLKFADFVLITNSEGRILFSNRAFILLISPTDETRTTENALNKNLRLWESVLAETVLGVNEVLNPVSARDFQTFEARRAEVRDDAEGGSLCYLNILRLKGAQPLPEKRLEKIDAIISNLSQYALLFSYGSTENKREYVNNLQEITDNLESFFKQKIKN